MIRCCSQAALSRLTRRFTDTNSKRISNSGRAPAFSRFVMIRPVQTTRPRSGEHCCFCCFCNGQGRRAVPNDPDIGPITRQRRGSAGPRLDAEWRCQGRTPFGRGSTAGTSAKAMLRTRPCRTSLRTITFTKYGSEPPFAGEIMGHMKCDVIDKLLAAGNTGRHER